MTGKRKKQRQKNRLIEMNKKRLIPGNKKGKGKIRGKKNNVKPRRGGDSMAEKRRMKQPPYVYGTAVEQTVPSRQPGREERNQIRHKRRVSRAVRRNQEKALQMDVPYVLALTVAAMSALYICVSYLQVQSTITGRIHNIEKLEQEVPDFPKWKYGFSDMAPYRKDIDAITNRWLQQVHPEHWSTIQETWNTLEKQQERAYGKSSRKQTYRMNQEKDLYKRCGNAILQTLREVEKEKRWREQSKLPLRYQKSKYRIPRIRIRRLERYFEDSYRHYKNLAAYDRAQRQAQWNQQQQQQEEEAHICEAIWLENEPE